MWRRRNHARRCHLGLHALCLHNTASTQPLLRACLFILFLPPMPRLCSPTARWTTQAAGWRALASWRRHSWLWLPRAPIHVSCDARPPSRLQKAAWHSLVACCLLGSPGLKRPTWCTLPHPHTHLLHCRLAHKHLACNVSYHRSALPIYPPNLPPACSLARTIHHCNPHLRCGVCQPDHHPCIRGAPLHAGQPSGSSYHCRSVARLACCP